MVFANGKLVEGGQVQCLNASPGGVGADAVFMGGWAIAPSGEGYVEDVGVGAVPADAVFLGGIAFAADGRMYVTTEAPSGASFLGGFAVRDDGALHVSTSAVEATDTFIGGIAVTPAGVARFFLT